MCEPSTTSGALPAASSCCSVLSTEPSAAVGESICTLIPGLAFSKGATSSRQYPLVRFGVTFTSIRTVPVAPESGSAAESASNPPLPLHAVVRARPNRMPTAALMDLFRAMSPSLSIMFYR
ncbi:hypothetical protein RKD48_007243 [Streptomyces ambofaciens]